MAKVWSDFYPYVMPEVAGCAAPSADQALREAAIEFYDKTGLLISQPAPITVVPGTGTYTLPTLAGYDVNRIEEFFMGTLRLIPVANSQLAQMYFDWLTITGSPQYYTRETTDTVRLVPSPDPNMTFPDALTARLVLVPTRAATGIAEDWVFENWADDISAGAIARLLRQPSKPWTDIQRALLFEDRSRRSWSAARTLSDRGQVGAVLSVRLKRFF